MANLNESINETDNMKPQAELVQQNNLSSDDRELHNIEEKMYKDKQIKDNLIVNKFKELYNDDEHSLKQMLNAIEMTDVVKIAYKENWQLVLEHLQNPEFGYECFKNIVFYTICDNILKDGDSSTKSLYELFKKRECQWNLKFKYLYKYFNSMKKTEQSSTEVTKNIPLSQKKTPNEILNCQETNSEITNDMPVNIIPLPKNTLVEQLSKQTSDSVTTQNNKNLTEKIQKIPTTKKESRSNTLLEKNLSLPAEIQHLPNIVCYAVPKMPLNDLTMDHDDDSDTISPNLDIIKLKPVPLAIPINPLPKDIDDDSDTIASNSDITKMKPVPSDPLQQHPNTNQIIVPEPKIENISLKTKTQENTNIPSVILSWDCCEPYQEDKIKSFEIFMCMKKNKSDTSETWIFVVRVLKLKLPMICSINMDLEKNYNYDFIIRTRDFYGNCSVFSKPECIIVA